MYQTIVCALPKQRIARERHFIRKYKSSLKDKNQQKFVITKEWSVKYSLYLKNQSQHPPSEINNTQLIELMKKKEKKLEENYDFVIMPAVIWNVLFKLYSGGPELPYSQIKHFNETFYDILSGSSLHPVGLRNDNKKKFPQNSVLQALLSIEELNNYLLNSRVKFKKYPTRYKLSSLISSLILVMKNANLNQTVSSKKLTALLSSQINDLQNLNALDFLKHYLELLLREENQENFESIPIIYEEHENINYSNATQFIQQLFYGQISNDYNCQICHNQWNTEEKFFELDFSLKFDNIKECIEHTFNSKDKLTICPHCQSLGSVTNVLTIKHQPSIQTAIFTESLQEPLQLIHNKYFIIYKQNGIEMRQIQLNTIYQASLLKTEIRLKSMSRQQKDAMNLIQWFLVDDEKIFTISEQNILKQKALIAFYAQG